MERTSTKDLVLGMLIGGALGMLFAPSKGEDLRKKIKNKAKNALDELENNAYEVSNVAQDKVKDIKEDALKKKDQVQSKAERLQNVLSDEVEKNKSNMEKSKNRVKKTLEN